MKRIIPISWVVLVGAALMVFISKGIFAQVAYQFNITGGDHAYAPAWFSMTIISVVYGIMLYIINRYETRQGHARIGIILGSIVIVSSQFLLAWTALASN